jgi:hypothetical protein
MEINIKERRIDHLQPPSLPLVEPQPATVSILSHTVGGKEKK